MKKELCLKEQQICLEMFFLHTFFPSKKMQKAKNKLKQQPFSCNTEKTFREEQQHQNFKKTICCSFKQKFFSSFRGLNFKLKEF